ncbi:Stk1 family PASTA domain-containing Ser/Thr kinase [Cytobacillus sp. IB215665]|uniref:Stk1 family PASTA domain-containing Ser/Thr kinase n=1 Tax=Cytobacillus sp. IB215665 TaxID=3097357 RepID=UPI002A15DEB6|nr:Stk1 family PASTA domain-containing Ser/Thr kinase [Cytobacillus sp. IB215665]MDX8365017.1 Stk1 family PASTA domain-containing Ser/Thr kinase [Cytobacillus sp. IB215665]
MLIGKRLNDRYDIVEVVGGGGMANVYLAKDMILDREVAIKVLRLDFSHDEEFIKRFRREAQAATSLAHPNIVTIYDVGEEDNIYYIVMEYVRGKTLKQYIQAYAPLSVQETLNIMEQLTSAISHAHQNQIVHRDIKPQNILVNNNGTVKITDFGIAMALSSTTITHTNSVLGSVHYLSPEQARGGLANKKSDIYSLGIVMFELLTGEIPFSGESVVSIALKHLQSETPSPKRWNPDIPQSVENIILKSTAKDTLHRYDSVDDMEVDIKSALDPEKMTEERFTLPVEDDEVTKAIPVLTNEQLLANEKTTVHEPQQLSSEETTKQLKQSKRKRLPVIITTTFFMLVIAAVLAVTLIPSLLTPDDVAVPDVKNMEYDEAVKKLEALDLVITKTIDQTSDEVIESLVIKTDPEDGAMVKPGAGINIYRSSGKEKFEFGDYIGDDYNRTKEQLQEKYNFTDVTKREQSSDEYDAGIIIDQSPDPDSLVIPDEQEVIFTVSKGPEKIILKDLTLRSQKGVIDYAEENGLNLDIRDGFDDDVAKGLVFKQSPEEGTELDKGAEVIVYLSKGKEEEPEETVKTYEKTFTITFEPKYDEDIVNEVVIYIDDAERYINEVYDTFPIRENETREETIEFKIEKGSKAEYKIVRDNIVLYEGTIKYKDIQD